MELGNKIKQRFFNSWHQLYLFYQRNIIKIGGCDLCGGSCQQFNLICQACYTDLPNFNFKHIQGDLLNWPAINKGLGKIHFDHLLCLAPYLPPFTQWMPQFKYQGRFELAQLFANMLTQQYLILSREYNIADPDLVLSVPLHISKWQKRGYNQAHLIAKSFTKTLSLPYNHQAIIRKNDTDSQVGKTGKERRKNLQNSFEIDQNIKRLPSHVALIDDVVTTGATANEITRLLKKAGVKKVTLIAVCLTLPN
jgi:ComF family protein